MRATITLHTEGQNSVHYTYVEKGEWEITYMSGLKICPACGTPETEQVFPHCATHTCYGCDAGESGRCKKVVCYYKRVPSIEVIREVLKHALVASARPYLDMSVIGNLEDSMAGYRQNAYNKINGKDVLGVIEKLLMPLTPFRYLKDLVGDLDGHPLLYDGLEPLLVRALCADMWENESRRKKLTRRLVNFLHKGSRDAVQAVAQEIVALHLKVQ